MKSHLYNRYITALTVILTALLLASCGTKKKAVRGDSGQKGRPGTETVTIAGNKRDEDHRAGDNRYAVDREIAQRLVAEARKWLGVPYKYGGNDTRGVDCSGLTMNVFSKAAGVKIPRNSGAQMEFTMALEQKHLQPGDLVFFSPSPGSNSVNHVGLYIGDRRIIHASSSRGVMISSLDERYFVTRYHSSGRVPAVTYHATHRTPPSRKAESQDVLMANASENSKTSDSSEKSKKNRKAAKKNRKEKIRVEPETPVERQITTVEGFAMKSDNGSDTLFVIERRKVPEISLDSLIRADSLRRIKQNTPESGKSTSAESKNSSPVDSLVGDSTSYVRVHKAERAQSSQKRAGKQAPEKIADAKPQQNTDIRKTPPAETSDSLSVPSPSDTTARTQVRKAFRRKKF